jgi:hypothetical protein
VVRAPGAVKREFEVRTSVDLDLTDVISSTTAAQGSRHF